MLQFSPYRAHQPHQIIQQKQPVIQQLQPFAQQVQPLMQNQARFFQKQVSQPQISQSKPQEGRNLQQQSTENLKVRIDEPSMNDSLKLVEERVHMLVAENKRLADQLKQKINECELYRKENQDIVFELHRLRGQEYEIDIIKEMAELRLKEGEKWRFRCNTLENHSKELIQVSQEQASKNTMLQQEINSWKNRYSDLDQDRLQQLEQTRNTLDGQYRIEIEDIRRQLQKKVDELEGNLMVVSNEYEALNQNLKRQTDENEQLRQKLFTSGINLEQDQLKQQLEAQRLLNSELENKVQNLQRDMQASQNLKGDGNSTQPQQEVKILLEKNKYLLNENQKLFFQNDNLTKELQVLSQRLSKSQV